MVPNNGVRSHRAILERMDGSRSQTSRGRPGGYELRREVVVHHQRERMLAATVELIAERGYRAVSVADIVKRAAIARAKFYENFASKEDCFFVVYDRAVAEALSSVSRACEQAEGSFAERLHGGLAALLGFLASDPALARACIVELPSVGPAGEARRDRALGDFAGLVRTARERTGETASPDGLEGSVLGGLYWLLYHAILDDEFESIEDLLPELTEFSLISFVGPETSRGDASTPSPPAG